MDITKIINKVKKGTIIVQVEGFFIERFINLCKIQNIEITEIKYMTAGYQEFRLNLQRMKHHLIILDK